MKDPISWFSARSLRREREPIDRSNWAALWTLTVLLLGSIIAGGFVGTNSSWGFLLSLVPAGLGGASLLWLSGYQRKATWHRGYLRGRASWLESMIESQARSLHPLEWLAGEMERDGVLTHVDYDPVTEEPLGLHVILPMPPPKET